MTLSSDQVRNVYVGLKQGEQYKKQYGAALVVIDSLNNIVQEQDYNLNLTLDQIKETDAKLKEAYEERQKLAVVKWYDNKYLYGIVSLIIGVIIAKQ